MHIELSKPPPERLVGWLEELYSGRYSVSGHKFMELMETEVELRSWLKYCKMFPLLIERVIADVKAKGICVLHSKGLIIRDTEWINPTTVVDWSMCKFPTYLKLSE